MSEIDEILSALERERRERFRELPRELVEKILVIERDCQEEPSRASQLISRLIEDHLASEAVKNVKG